MISLTSHILGFASISVSSLLGMVVVAGVLAATTTWSRCFAVYVLFESIYLASKYTRPTYGTSKSDVGTTNPAPKVGLWKDILAGLDDKGSKGVQDWISTVFGVAIDRVKRGNVEELLAGSIFGSPLAQIRDDSLKYHILNKAVIELEIRRNKRFSVGYNTGISLPIQYRHQQEALQEGYKFLFQIVLECLANFALYGILRLFGFQTVSPGVSCSGGQREQSKSEHQINSPVMLLVEGPWNVFRMIPTILELRRSSDHPIYILNTAYLPVTGPDSGPAESGLSLDNISSPGDRVRKPILVVNRGCIRLASQLIKDSPASSIVLIDPLIHPLLSIIFDPTSIPLARQSIGSDISLLAPSGCIARVILTASMPVEESVMVKRYCDLKSIPYDFATSRPFSDSRGFVPVVVGACKFIVAEQASISADTQPNSTKLIELEATPADDDVSIQNSMITLLSTSAMMSTLENISSIGMCLAPPFRTRQRSKSLGTVVGYGHVDGLRRPSMVVGTDTEVSQSVNLMAEVKT